MEGSCPILDRTDGVPYHIHQLHNTSEYVNEYYINDQRKIKKYARMYSTASTGRRCGKVGTELIISNSEQDNEQNIG